MFLIFTALLYVVSLNTSRDNQEILSFVVVLSEAAISIHQQQRNPQAQGKDLGLMSPPAHAAFRSRFMYRGYQLHLCSPRGASCCSDLAAGSPNEALKRWHLFSSNLRFVLLFLGKKKSNEPCVSPSRQHGGWRTNKPNKYTEI